MERLKVSNTYYCICIDCEKVVSLKEGEEEEFKDKHYGHEILIYYYAHFQIVHYEPEEKIVEYANFKEDEK